MFVVDVDRTLVAFNAGCEALTGWTAEEVLGERCLYGSVPETNTAHALAASLCPPAEVFQGQPLTVPARIVKRSGESVARQIQFVPLRDDDQELAAIVGFLLPPDLPAPPAVVELPARLHADLTALRTRLRSRFGAQSLVARSPAMARVLAQVELAQFSPAFVLLRGEPGTGKEHLARVIHFGGAAKANWFVPLDCRRLGADELTRVIARLLELHSPSRSGPEPQPGTIFLGDVELLPRDLQARLAESFLPLLRPRLRLMASTTVDLEAFSERGEFRRDLLHLLSVIPIDVPSLRERGDDCRLLAVGFLEDLNRQGTKQVNGFQDEVWPLFERYRWPGNLDELATAVREAYEATTETLIRPADLPFRFRAALQMQEEPPAPSLPKWDLEATLARVESQMIRLALERAKGNRSEAAELLGINRARLLRRLAQLGFLEAGEPAAPEAGDAFSG